MAGMLVRVVFKRRSFHFMDMTASRHLLNFIMWHFEGPRNALVTKIAYGVSDIKGYARFAAAHAIRAHLAFDSGSYPGFCTLQSP